VARSFRPTLRSRLPPGFILASYDPSAYEPPSELRAALKAIERHFPRLLEIADEQDLAHHLREKAGVYGVRLFQIAKLPKDGWDGIHPGGWRLVRSELQDFLLSVPVTVEKGSKGRRGRVIDPTAEQIFARALQSMGTEPTDPAGVMERITGAPSTDIVGDLEILPIDWSLLKYVTETRYHVTAHTRRPGRVDRVPDTYREEREQDYSRAHATPLFEDGALKEDFEYVVAGVTEKGSRRVTLIDPTNDASISVPFEDFLTHFRRLTYNEGRAKTPLPPWVREWQNLGWRALKLYLGWP
jgi:hypothetical protein